MVNVVTKHCRHSNCITRPTYGMPGRTSEFCAKHKEPGMINVIDRLCGHDGCYKIPSFAAKGSRASFCKEHKESDMVNVNIRKRSVPANPVEAPSGPTPTPPPFGPATPDPAVPANPVEAASGPTPTPPPFGPATPDPAARGADDDAVADGYDFLLGAAPEAQASDSEFPEDM